MYRIASQECHPSDSEDHVLECTEEERQRGWTIRSAYSFFEAGIIREGRKEGGILKVRSTG